MTPVEESSVVVDPYNSSAKLNGEKNGAVWTKKDDEKSSKDGDTDSKNEEDKPMVGVFEVVSNLRNTVASAVIQGPYSLKFRFEA